MIGAYDTGVQLPILDLYDTRMMLAAQSAAKDMYDQAQQEIKDFKKEYGDFITPILADQEWYNNNVTGRIRNFINDAYSKGIDLTRSAEGRAAIAQMINSIDVGSVAKLRSSKAAAEEYLKNRGRLEAAGLYNPDLEERYLGYDLAGWDTLHGGRGVWDRTSPTEAKTLKELTEAWYNNRTPEMLNEEDVKSFGMDYDRRYNYTGFADRHLLDIAAGETPGWRGSLYADYYRDLAEQKVRSRGIPYTQKDVEAQLQRDVATANREYKSIKRDADDFAKIDVQFRNQMALQKQAQTAAERLARIKGEIKDNPSNSKSWTHRQQVGVMQNDKYKSYLKHDLQIARYNATFTGAKKQLINEGIKNPTMDQINARINANKKYLQNPELYAKHYAAYTTNVEGNDLLTARALFAGLSKEEAVGDINGIKRRPIQFNPKSNLSLTLLRQRKYGGVKFGSNKLQEYLDKHHIQGHVPYDMATVSYKDYSPGRGVYDINSTVSIKASDLDGFGKNAEERINALRNVGGVFIDSNGKIVTDDKKIGWSDVARIELPVSRTIDSHSYVDSEIDSYHEALNYTKTIAKKLEGQFENNDLTEMTYE